MALVSRILEQNNLRVDQMPENQSIGQSITPSEVVKKKIRGWVITKFKEIWEWLKKWCIFFIFFITFLLGLYISKLGIEYLYNNHFGYSLLYIGIGSFLLSVVIMSIFTYYSIPSEKVEKRVNSLLKLDRKEIRRSIAISFTILYIILISFYVREVESVTHVISAVNTSVNETVLNVTANSSFTTITILNETTNLTGNGLTGDSLTHLSNVITAFTSVYLVIIGFYFGSRVYEKIKENKDAENALKIQYIMDEIDEHEFKEKMWVLRGVKLLFEVTTNDEQIIIHHKGGDDIHLKKINIIIKVKGREMKISFKSNGDKEYVFKVTDKIFIDMKNGTKTIKLNNTEIKGDIVHGGIDALWEKNAEVEVYMVYTSNKEIICSMKGKIDPK